MAETTRKRAPGAGRKTLPSGQKLVKLELFVPPALAAWFAAEEWATIDKDEQRRQARARKQAAARLLVTQEIQSRIV